MHKIDSFALFPYSFVQLERVLSKQHRCLWKTHDLSWTHSTGKGMRISKHAWAIAIHSVIECDAFLYFSLVYKIEFHTWRYFYFMLKLKSCLTTNGPFLTRRKIKVLLFPCTIAVLRVATNIELLVFKVTLVCSLLFYKGFKGLLILFMILN